MWASLDKHTPSLLWTLQSSAEILLTAQMCAPHSKTTYSTPKGSLAVSQAPNRYTVSLALTVTQTVTKY